MAKTLSGITYISFWLHSILDGYFLGSPEYYIQILLVFVVLTGSINSNQAIIPTFSDLLNNYLTVDLAHINWCIILRPPYILDSNSSWSFSRQFMKFLENLKFWARKKRTNSLYRITDALTISDGAQNN